MRTEVGPCCDFPACRQAAVMTVGLLLAKVSESRELCSAHAREAIDMADGLGIAPRLSRICEFGVVLTIGEALDVLDRVLLGGARPPTLAELVNEDRCGEVKDLARRSVLAFVAGRPNATAGEVAEALGLEGRFAGGILGDLKRRGRLGGEGTPVRYCLIDADDASPAHVPARGAA